ncbi:MAG TPA: HEAT repeat domain-containing protein [Chloroflexota bacterium]|nr:HEAT repeat domain-containing protein [Chloroflexota bacterium]
MGTPDPAALAALCRTLRDEPYPWVRMAAATALGRLPADGDEVTTTLRDARADRDGRVRSATREALARRAP